MNDPNMTLSTPEAKTRVLIESLPWMERFAGSIMVVKYGGNALAGDDENSQALRKAFAEDMVFLHRVGIKPVVVHGGGPQVTTMLSRLGIDSEFVGGLRVTTPEAMDVVRMVLVGQVGRHLVGLINEHGPYAVGLSGEDGALLEAERITTVIDGEEVDLGQVGEVAAVHPSAIVDLLDAGRIPVISTIAPERGNPGSVLNVNADTAAAALAVALKASRMVILTDVEGLYRNWPDRNSLISSLSAAELRELLPNLESGMIPKMQACLAAVDGGVNSASVVDGRSQHTILLEIFTDGGQGTQVVATTNPDAP